MYKELLQLHITNLFFECNYIFFTSIESSHNFTNHYFFVTFREIVEFSPLMSEIDKIKLIRVFAKRPNLTI